MSDSNERVSPQERGNPFPAVAVAGVSLLDPPPVTIETAAIREADERLDSYLAHRATTNGNVLAIVGEFGTGKTHLLMHLLRRALRGGLRDVNWRYVDAPADTFLALYLERFIGRMRPEDVAERVRDYYADIVAESLAGFDLGFDVAQGFRDGTLDPQTVAERVGLSPDLLLRSLRDRLRAVTKDDAFSTALSLLLRPGFRSATWEWLNGNPPDPILIERGIAGPIATDAAALESIGVFALLYGGQGHRFILMIDELEKILSATSRPETSTAQAFKKLLEVSSDAGAFLVLSGVQDFLKPLGDDTRGRIGPAVRMSALNSIEVRRFIEDTLQKAYGERTIGPFTPETIGYLTQVTNGNPRQVVQLCATLYERADGAVTEPLVRAALSEQKTLTVEDMRADVRRLLNLRGWPVRRDHMSGDPSKPRVDYWIPVGGGEAGVCVLLTDAVLEPAKREHLERRIQAIEEASPESRILLVVNGYLAPGLGSAMQEEPLVYERNGFAEDFDAAMLGAMRRVEAATGGDPLTRVQERLDRMYQLQSNTQSVLEHFTASLDAVRWSTEQQFEMLRHGLGTAARHFPEEGSELPLPVRRLFDEARDSLGDLDQVEALVGDAFAAEGEEDTLLAKRTLLQRLRRDVYQPIGIAALMRQLVAAFRGQLSAWYSPIRSGSLTGGELSRLKTLCGTYDSIYDHLPLFQLNVLARMTAETHEHGAARPGPPDVRRAFDRLGARVQAAMLESLETT